MTTARDPVSVRVKAGLYELTFALTMDDLDEAVALVSGRESACDLIDRAHGLVTGCVISYNGVVRISRVREAGRDIFRISN